MKEISKIEQILGRHRNYHYMEPKGQWIDDKKNGLLDWDGSDNIPTAALERMRRLQDPYTLLEEFVQENNLAIITYEGEGDEKEEVPRGITSELINGFLRKKGFK